MLRERFIEDNTDIRIRTQVVINSKVTTAPATGYRTEKTHNEVFIRHNTTSWIATIVITQNAFWSKAQTPQVTNLTHWSFLVNCRKANANPMINRGTKNCSILARIPGDWLEVDDAFEGGL